VSEHGCEQWNEAIAMHVFGRLPAAEEVALLAHLEGCDACRSLATEMTETFALLEHVDAGAIAASASVSPELSERVLRELHRAGVHQRRTRIVRVASVSCVGALAASLILVGVFSGTSKPAPQQRAVALRGAASVKASAELVAQPWGTTVKLRERGLPSGTLYTVSMESDNGTWWTAGTYRSVSGKTVKATMTCAVALSRITNVRVVNGAGVMVLSNYS
jgi:predicted anti-sigma-YlaC factor YlaD